MRRTAAMCAGLLLVLSGCRTQHQMRAFGGVPFGSPPEVVHQAMVGIGLAPAPRPEKKYPNDQLFKGRLRDLPASVSATYDGAGGLVKMAVGFETGDQTDIFYRTLRGELDAKYGYPARTVSSGMALWDIDGGQIYIVNEEEAHAVVVSYDAPGWTAELNRRRAANVSLY